MSKVSFIKSDDRKYNIERCLSLIKSEIMAGVKNAKRIVVKPSCFIDDFQLVSTHIDALDALLNFIKPYTKTQIIIAEGTTIGNTIKAFENYNYLKLQEKYDFAVVDLNVDEFETIKLTGKNGKNSEVKIAKTILESDYLISLASPKTHNEIAYSGTIESAVSGSLIRPNLSLNKKIAQKFNKKIENKYPNSNPEIINQNIKTIFEKIPLQLAVIDAFTTMQANGPINGEMVPTHFAIASSDSIAADWLVCQILGINLSDIKYLSMLEAEKEECFVIGDDWQKNIIKIKMPNNFEKLN